MPKLEETLQHPQLGPLTHVGFPVRMTDFRFAVARQAPAAGAHTDKVLREPGYGNRTSLP